MIPREASDALALPTKTNVKTLEGATSSALLQRTALAYLAFSDFVGRWVMGLTRRVTGAVFFPVELAADGTWWSDGRCPNSRARGACARRSRRMVTRTHWLKRGSCLAATWAPVSTFRAASDRARDEASRRVASCRRPSDYAGGAGCGWPRNAGPVANQVDGPQARSALAFWRVSAAAGRLVKSWGGRKRPGSAAGGNEAASSGGGQQRPGKREEETWDRWVDGLKEDIEAAADLAPEVDQQYELEEEEGGAMSVISEGACKPSKSRRNASGSRTWADKPLWGIGCADTGYGPS